jgi:hypothetical protein
MNGRNHIEPVAKILRRSGVFACLVAVLLLTSATQGQAQSTPPVSQAPGAAQAPAVTWSSGTQPASAAQATVPASSRPADTAPTGSRKPKEGLTVHGYWKIDVRNPDGTLAKHLEFENQLCTTFTDPTGTETVLGGDTTLSNLLMGTASRGAWSIILGTPETATGATPNCAFNASYMMGQTSTNFPGYSTNTNQSLSLPFDGPLDWFCDGGSFLNNNQGFACFPALNASYAQTVSLNEGNNYTLPEHQNSGLGVTLSGQFTAPSGYPGVTISAVGTNLYTCAGDPSPIDCQNFGAYLGTAIPGGNGSSACFASNAFNRLYPFNEIGVSSYSASVPCGGSYPYGTSIMTFRVGNLFGLNPFSGVVLTGNNGTPAPFTVVAGQTVAVNWTLSFQ